MEEIQGHIYDYPKYYDLVYGSDWKAEYEFLLKVIDRYSKRTVKSLFEPACGTGRLMIKFAQSGFQVSGNDLNANAIDFCNDRLERHGYPRSAFVGDMSDFKLPKRADLAFNMINSFRHLPTEKSAESHFKCIANALNKDGLYVLGLHLTPLIGDRVEKESWPARRGNLAVISSLWSESIDIKNRNEKVGMSFDIYTPTKSYRIVDEMDYRIYTAKQMIKLLERVNLFQLEVAFDFVYDVDEPICIDDSVEDVVLILRKK